MSEKTPENSSRAASDEEDAEPVVILPAVEAEPEPGDAATLSPTESFTGPEDAAEEEEDVFVILPEGDEANIPVVETQVVEETDLPGEVDGSHNTEFLPTADTADTAAIEGVHGDPTDGAPEFAETPVGEEGLEQMASELDNELLTGAGAGLAEAGTGPGGDSTGLGDESADSGEIASIAKPARSRWMLSAAAALLLGLGGYYFFHSSLNTILGRGGPGGLANSSGVKTAAPSVLPLTAPPVSSAPTVVAVPPEVPAIKDLAAEAREAFHEKFLVAVELGYVGEVRNE